jgi:hypothetical protein
MGYQFLHDDIAAHIEAPRRVDVHTVKAMVRLSVASFDATDHATDFSFSVAANAATDFRAPQPPILSTMELCDLPLYAVQRLANGTWLVRSPIGDPILPAVDVVAVVGAQTDIRRDPQSAAAEAASA